MKTSPYDAIVLGTGGVGSAALFHLARRGQRVLGIDRFPPAHDRGSSHGRTRVIRQAYFEHSDYVPLLLQAYELWRELEQLGQKQLFFPVGLIEIGPPDGVVLPGVIRSARQHGLEIEQLSPSEVRTRFPGFELGDGLQAVFEPTAGYLLVEDCVAEHLRLAREAGADYVNATVRSWSEQAKDTLVQTDRETFRAKQLVICGGAWASQLLDGLSLELRVTAKHLYWCAADQRYQAEAGCPTFFYETSPGVYFYGFPQIDSRGLKVAEHSGGVEVNDPSALCRDVDPLDQARVMEFVARYLPGVEAEVSARSVCMYTMSPDEHFVVDVHPRCDNVVFAAGLSGHGFKFTPVLGKALADLALDGRSSLPIDFLSLRRRAS